VACELYTITGSGDGSIIAWDNRCADFAPTILNKTPIGVHHLSISGNTLASVGFDGKIVLHDLDNLGTSTRIEQIEDAWAVALSPDGNQLVASIIDKGLVYYDVANKKLLNSFSGNGHLGLTVDFVSTNLSTV
jgi:WD40 repeat protein